MRARHLTRDEWRVLAEALLLTPITALSIRWFALDRAIGMASRTFSRPSGSPLSPARMAALVNIGSLGGRCLTKALVLHGVLSRRGVASSVVVGTAVEGELLAHAWVESGGRVLIGEGLRPYTPLVRFASAAGQAWRG